ncbi:MAG: c-type cytochrome [Janthinobacterium lividum]
MKILSGPKWAILAFSCVTILLVGLIVLVRLPADRRGRVMRSDPDLILADAELRAIALPPGRQAFVDHCASCHGNDGRGDHVLGVPDLTDNSFLYGQGSVAQIEQITLHGIRAGDTKGWDLARMPGYAKAVPYDRERLPSLTPREIDDIVAWLRAANGHPAQPVAIARGGNLYHAKAGCWDCHGQDATGDDSIGAPSLTDRKWLVGNDSPANLFRIVAGGLHGVSPAFARRLDPFTARAVSVYVATLHASRR